MYFFVGTRLPLLQALHWLPVQARIGYSQLSVTTSSPTHLLPISLTFSLCTPLPNSFVLLQTHGYFVSPVLEKRRVFANAVSPTSSKAMEFAPFWHPSHSLLQCLQNKSLAATKTSSAPPLFADAIPKIRFCRRMALLVRHKMKKM